jgi:hypothetical protein
MIKPGRAVTRSTLFLEGDELDAQGWLRAKAARQAAGLASIFLKPSAVRSQFGISARAALLVHGGFVVNPRTTTVDLLRAAVKRRTRIFSPVDIVDVEYKLRRSDGAET